jgi:4-hydroxyphenylpyruvate dioxygenase-like putative hemolysin
MVDADEDGYLFHKIFTKPVQDDQHYFFEIIQRMVHAKGVLQGKKVL